MNESVMEKVAETIRTNEDDVKMITGLVVGFLYIDSDGDQSRGYYQLPGQNSITSNGLADMITHYARQNFSHEEE